MIDDSCWLIDWMIIEQNETNLILSFVGDLFHSRAHHVNDYQSYVIYKTR